MLSKFSSGTLQTTMHKNVNSVSRFNLSCNIYCEKTSDNTAEINLIYSGVYRNGKKISFIAERKNDTWSGLAKNFQIFEFIVRSYNEDITMGDYNSYNPRDKGNFILKSCKDKSDWPDFKNFLEVNEEEKCWCCIF